MIVAAAVGLIAGATVGMLMPNLAASVVASLSGVVLFVLALGRLAADHLSVAERLPHTPRMWLLGLYTCTAAGTAGPVTRRTDLPALRASP